MLFKPPKATTFLVARVMSHSDRIKRHKFTDYRALCLQFILCPLQGIFCRISETRCSCIKQSNRRSMKSVYIGVLCGQKKSVSEPWEGYLCSFESISRTRARRYVEKVKWYVYFPNFTASCLHREQCCLSSTSFSLFHAIRTNIKIEA